MAILYITEYAGTRDGAPLEPAMATQVVTIGVSSAASAAFGTQTKCVELRTDAICSVRFGSAPTAAATDTRLAAGDSKLVAVNNNAGNLQKVAVITNT